MNMYFNLNNHKEAISKALKENIQNGIKYKTCHECGKQKVYKMIDCNKIVKNQTIEQGKKPICQSCYYELIKD